MKLLMMVAVVSLLGCGDKQPPAEQSAKIPTSPEPAKLSAFKTRGLAELAKITEFKDAMCKCHDRACATKVLDGHQAWMDAQPADHTKPGPGEEAEIKGLMTVVFNEQKACIEKALVSAFKVKALEGVAKFTELKNAMCKCQQGDGECVGKAMVAQKQWSDEVAANPNKEKPGPGEKDEIMALFKPLLAEHKQCMTRALGLPDEASASR